MYLDVVNVSLSDSAAKLSSIKGSISSAGIVEFVISSSFSVLFTKLSKSDCGNVVVNPFKISESFVLYKIFCSSAFVLKNKHNLFFGITKARFYIPELSMKTRN